MIPLLGYANRLSGRPGDEIEFKVSSTFTEPYEADLIRVTCADPNPEGPGIRYEEVPASFTGRYPSRAQEYQVGSYVKITHNGGIAVTESFTLVAAIWPTMAGRGEQVIFDGYDPGVQKGIALYLDHGGSLCGRVGSLEGPLELSATQPLRNKNWYRIWLTYDAEKELLEVGQVRVKGGTSKKQSFAVAARKLEVSLPSELLIAAGRGARRHGHFNGKIEAPALFSGVRSDVPPQGPEDSCCLAWWDFSLGIPTLEVRDKGPAACHGRIVNLPTRGVTGSNWTGHEMCWRHAPEQYGAIHFHDDDFYDCGWETDFKFEIPNGFRSGNYAVRLRCGENEDTIPFFVCAPKGRRQADLCVLISSFTYVIYSNHARHDFGPELKERMAKWQAYPWNPAEHPEFGLSAYNLHNDGSGIGIVSSQRPMLTLKSGFLTLATPGSGSGLRHYQADSHLFAWLDAKGIDFDVVTDQELHDDGVAALQPYKAVLTGSHPEYHTAETLDALQQYRDAGGNIGYLGGNGFYWRVALHREAPGAIEIRRAEGGIRTWAADTGEYYNAFDGEYGGLWRRNARPPQALVGVGFTAQGTFLGASYHRTKASKDPRVSWIFDGIEDEVLGDFGLSGGGAAGYEIDRADPGLGSPDEILVIAQSREHGPSYVAVFEDLLSHVHTVTGERPEDLVRADMTYAEYPGGGAVFSVGSITFCGSLPSSNFENNISKLLENLVIRFLA